MKKTLTILLLTTLLFGCNVSPNDNAIYIKENNAETYTLILNQADGDVKELNRQADAAYEMLYGKNRRGTLEIKEIKSIVYRNTDLLKRSANFVRMLEEVNQKMEKKNKAL